MNKITKIYCTNLHVKLKKSHESYDKYTFGHVYAFVKCNDAYSALKSFRKELNIQELTLTSFEFICPFEDLEWEDKELGIHFKQLADEASKSDNVIFDIIYCQSRN